VNSSPSLYPAGVSAAVRSQWEAAGRSPSLLPDEPLLTQLIDAAYQASLLREEREPVRCRIALGSVADFQSDSLTTLIFRNKVPLTAHEIRKLAGAAGFYRSLLAVEVRENAPLSVWGIVNTGTRWVNRVNGGRLDDVPLPSNLVLQIIGPGHLVIGSGDFRILETSGGVLLTDAFDPFLSKWLPQRFHSVRQSLLQSLPPPAPGELSTRICDSFVKDAAQSVIRRVLSLVCTRGHGGMLIYVCDQEDAESLAAKWFRFRVFFRQDRGTRRHRNLMERLVRRLLEIGRAQNMTEITWNDYRRIIDTEVEDLDEALMEFAHLLADFMSVDGAVVLDRAFRVIGFGAEILGDSHVSTIRRALDLEADRTISEPADASGTRHRAAYRLVSGVPDVLALVVSQDGAVRFVASHNQQLTYWPYLP